MAKTLATALSLDEFNTKVLEGEIFEVSVLSGQIRILCPTLHSATGRACGAHLKDEWLIKEKREGRTQMRVVCYVCRKFIGLRLIGASGWINGQYHTRD